MHVTCIVHACYMTMHVACMVAYAWVTMHGTCIVSNSMHVTCIFHATSMSSWLPRLDFPALFPLAYVRMSFAVNLVHPYVILHHARL